jgi:hypothetical protein
MTPRRNPPAVAGILATILLGACGGGGGGTTGGGGGGGDANANALEPYAQPLTDADLRYFLERTQFGGGDAQVAALRSEGLERSLDKMLAFAADTPVERAAELQIHDLREPRMDELVRYWLFLMLRSENPFQELLAFLWHDHFAVSQNVLDDDARRFYLEHIRLLRRHAAGNLRELSYQLAIDPAMLVWLDGFSSTRQKPNENFAREFWEIFTLGRNQGYTQQDIVEAARAFTGWRLIRDAKTGEYFSLFDPNLHDGGPKTIFGRTGNFGYREVVDLTFDARPAAERFARVLFRYFCHADPSPSVIAQMAAILRGAGYEAKPLLKVLLRSKAFFSPTSRRSWVKTPLEYVIGLMRTTGLELPVAETYEVLISLRQVPTMPPSVFGWPEGSDWLGAQPVLERGNVVNELLAAREYHLLLGRGVQQLLPPAEQRTAASVVDAFAARLQLQLSAPERDKLIQFLNSEASMQNNELQIKASPFDGTDTRHIDERARGLLFILSQHPLYHLR